MTSTGVKQMSHNHHYPFAFLNHLRECRIQHQPQIVSNSIQYQQLQQLIIENTAHEYVKFIASMFFNLIYCAQLLRYYINEYSPLVLFSWWRNKIS